MTSLINNLTKDMKISPPKWLPNSVIYETMVGSFSYGVSSDTSDVDLIGICIPEKYILFPHLAGKIPGFGKQEETFAQFSQHHIDYKQKEYDVTIYNIVKWFQLTMENNPNMVDSLFVKRNAILHIDNIGQHIRDNRKLFLHKGSYHKLRGYAYAQLSKLKKHSNASNPKRQADIEKYGYDCKFAYHIIRLVLQAEQILIEHDLDLHANINILKSIRNGEWSLEKIYSWFDTKEAHLEELYIKSTLREKPDEHAIKQILVNCLEMKYGNLKSIQFQTPTKEGELLKDLEKLVYRYKV